MTTAITDHEVQAPNRLRDVLREKTTIPALVQALADPSNAVDAAIMQLLLERSIDTAIGTQLDDIGAIVGISREEIDSSLVDSDYRRYVRAQIWTLNSDGLTEDILRVIRLVIDDDDASYVLEQLFPAGILLRIEDIAVSSDVSDIVALYMRATVSAGVKIQLISNTQVPTKTFRTAIATYLNGNFDDTAGGTANVDDTTLFPDSGTLRFSEGTSDDIAADLAYTGKTATSFTGVAVGAGEIHLDNGAVRLVRTPNQGFPAFFTLLNGSYTGGATMTVDDTTDAPSSGTLTLSKGLSVEETVTYTGKTPTTFTGCVAAESNTHADNSSVTELDSGGHLTSVKE